MTKALTRIFYACTWLAAAWVCTPAVLAAEAGRGEELAGEPSASQPALQAPEFKAPEEKMAPAGAQAQPSLKLPEVVIKGERQFQITAERRDLATFDPMTGAKEIPEDLSRTAIPGLDESKYAPAAETTTAKNFFFVAEGGAGPDLFSEGRLVAGQGWSQFDYLLHADYAAGRTPPAFGFTPFAQTLNAVLDARGRMGAAVDLGGSLFLQAESGRLPQADGRGDWLERGKGGIKLQGHVAPARESDIKISTLAGSLILQDEKPRSVFQQFQFFDVNGGYEQGIPGIMSKGFSLLLEFKGKGQYLQAGREWVHPSWETLKTLALSGRLHPWAWLHFDLGVQLDEFLTNAGEGTSASNIISQASLLLPFGATLYGSALPGLNWELVSEWIFKNPRPEWDTQPLFSGIGRILPWPEKVTASYQAGWRQRYNDFISSDVSWFLRRAQNTPAWLDPDRNGLFAYTNLAESLVTGVQAELEIRYSQRVRQTAAYLHRRADAGSGLHLPYVPAQEFKTEISVETAPVTTTLTYRYLGQRFGDPSPEVPALEAAHLAGVKVDAELNKNLGLYLKLENLLGYTWDEWLGYPGRGFAALLGARVQF